nr:MAG TPA: hypothetical protein [Caudoviricetes sp.]
MSEYFENSEYSEYLSNFLIIYFENFLLHSIEVLNNKKIKSPIYFLKLLYFTYNL